MWKIVENWVDIHNRTKYYVTAILRNKVKVAHIHITFHPTIRYEVFWYVHGRCAGAERCETKEKGLQIVKSFFAERGVF